MKFLDQVKSHFNQRLFFVPIALLILGGTACTKRERFSELHEMYQILLKNKNAIRNDSYKRKLEDGDSPHMLKTIKFKGESSEYNLLAFNNSYCCGLLVIRGNNKVYLWEEGPILALLSSEDWPFLKDKEILIITTTGGMGTYQVFGIVFSLRSDKVMYHFPIRGAEANIPNANFSYEISFLRQEKNQLKGGGLITAEKVTKDPDCDIAYLKEDHLKVPFTFGVNLDRPTSHLSLDLSDLSKILHPLEVERVIPPISPALALPKIIEESL